jgi:hypothetical protein
MRADADKPSAPSGDALSAVPVRSATPSPAAGFGEWCAQLLAGLRAGGPVVITQAAGVIGLMVLGSAVMWIGLPFGWLWLGSRMQNGLTPSIGPYLLIAVGLPVTMIGVARLLRQLDRAFARLSGSDSEDRHVPLPWVKSMRDGRGHGRQVTVLEVVMIASVLLCGLAMGIWFLVFAGAPPSSVGNGGLHL